MKQQISPKKSTTIPVDTTNVTVLTESQGEVWLSLSLSLQNGVVSVIIEKHMPLPVPIDTTLGSWSSEQAWCFRAVNPTLEEIRMLWSYFSSTSTYTRKQLKELITNSLKEHDIVSIAATSRLLR